MPVQLLKPNAEHRDVDKTWHPDQIMFWSFVVAVAVAVCLILAVNSTLPTEQRTDMASHSGMVP
jgi:hypothetical protein